MKKYLTLIIVSFAFLVFYIFLFKPDNIEKLKTEELFESEKKSVPITYKEKLKADQKVISQLSIKDLISDDARVQEIAFNKLVKEIYQYGVNDDIFFLKAPKKLFSILEEALSSKNSDTVIRSSHAVFYLARVMGTARLKKVMEGIEIDEKLILIIQAFEQSNINRELYKLAINSKDTKVNEYAAFAILYQDHLTQNNDNFINHVLKSNNNVKITSGVLQSIIPGLYFGFKSNTTTPRVLSHELLSNIVALLDSPEKAVQRAATKILIYSDTHQTNKALLYSLRENINIDKFTVIIDILKTRSKESLVNNKEIYDLYEFVQGQKKEHIYNGFMLWLKENDAK